MNIFRETENIEILILQIVHGHLFLSATAHEYLYLPVLHSSVFMSDAVKMYVQQRLCLLRHATPTCVLSAKMVSLRLGSLVFVMFVQTKSDAFLPLNTVSVISNRTNADGSHFDCDELFDANFFFPDAQTIRSFYPKEVGVQKEVYFKLSSKKPKNRDFGNMIFFSSWQSFRSITRFPCTKPLAVSMGKLSIADRRLLAVHMQYGSEGSKKFAWLLRKGYTKHQIARWKDVPFTAPDADFEDLRH